MPGESFDFRHACLLVGGLALFVYGMTLASDGLRMSAGGAMRAILGMLTRNRLAALVVGMVATVLLQSSGATTVMLVGLADSGFLTLAQAAAVILGSDIGTTVTVQLIAFDVVNYALLALAAGVVLTLVPRRRRTVHLGRLLIGVGLVFFGMTVMKSGVEPMKHAPAVRDALAAMAERPVMGLLAGAAFTALLHSSAATAAMVIALASQGMLPLTGAIAVILGANIGTCSTAGLAAMGAKREGARVAAVHLLFKLAGALAMLPFVGGFAQIVEEATALTGGGAARAVANAHTLFNVAIALVFLPFTGALAGIVRRVIPDRSAAAPGGVLYLGGHPDSVAYVELRRLAKEIAHMAERAAAIVARSLDVVFGSEPAAREVKAIDEEMDGIYSETVRYASEVAAGDVSAAEASELARAASMAKELEYVGDLVSKDLVTLGSKLAAEEGSFSMAGAAELRELHAEALAGLGDLARALSASADGRRPGAAVDAAASLAVERRERSLDEMLRRVLREHFDRLRKGVTEAVRTDAIFTDSANTLRQIHRHVLEACRIGGAAAEAAQPDGVGFIDEISTAGPSGAKE